MEGTESVTKPLREEEKGRMGPDKERTRETEGRRKRRRGRKGSGGRHKVWLQCPLMRGTESKGGCERWTEESGTLPDESSEGE